MDHLGIKRIIKESTIGCYWYFRSLSAGSEDLVRVTTMGDILKKGFNVSGHVKVEIRSAIWVDFDAGNKLSFIHN